MTYENDTKYLFLMVMVNLSGFDTNLVSRFEYMFSECSLVKSINLIDFTTNNARDMSSMFSMAGNLIDLDISHFNINNNCDVESMFNGCNQELIEKVKNQQPLLSNKAFN